jgi:hypothetical protein
MHDIKFPRKMIDNGCNLTKLPKDGQILKGNVELERNRTKTETLFWMLEWTKTKQTYPGSLQTYPCTFKVSQMYGVYLNYRHSTKPVPYIITGFCTASCRISKFNVSPVWSVFGALLPSQTTRKLTQQQEGSKNWPHGWHIEIGSKYSTTPGNQYLVTCVCAVQLSMKLVPNYNQQSIPRHQLLAHQITKWKQPVLELLSTGTTSRTVS